MVVKKTTKKSKINKKSKMTDEERKRVEVLRNEIRDYYDSIPLILRHAPESQEHCLELLLDAERNLSPPITRDDIIGSRLDVTRVKIEIGRARSSRWSFGIVAVIVYMFAAVMALLIYGGIIDVKSTTTVYSDFKIMGIPLLVIVWSVIGSFTSMLLRAGQLPFASISDAVRWLLFRPIVGVVMGILTYLMVTAGLIVFVGSGQIRTVELLWVIAFVGSFSDTLSITLLQKIVGRFHLVEEQPETGEETKTK